MLEKIRLSVLKVMFIVALLGAFVGTLFAKKEYHYPVRWLLHFLVGSGRDLKVPDYIVVGAQSALERAMRDNDYDNTRVTGRYCVNHSTLYDGSGFHGRPTLFYLLGGFTFYYDEATGRVSGHDEYDWHSNGDGNYFTSPLGDGKVMTAIVKVMGKLFGDDLFVVDGWPCGETGISNKLWEEFYKVGAKSFNSVFDCYVEFDSNFLANIRRNMAHNLFYEIVEDRDYERVYDVDDNQYIYELCPTVDEFKYLYFDFMSGDYTFLNKMLSSILDNYLEEQALAEKLRRAEIESKRRNRRDRRPRGSRPQRPALPARPRRS